MFPDTIAMLWVDVLFYYLDLFFHSNTGVSFISSGISLVIYLPFFFVIPSDNSSCAPIFFSSHFRIGTVNWLLCHPISVGPLPLARNTRLNAAPCAAHSYSQRCSLQPCVSKLLTHTSNEDFICLNVIFVPHLGGDTQVHFLFLKYQSTTTSICFTQGSILLVHATCFSCFNGWLYFRPTSQY